MAIAERELCGSGCGAPIAFSFSMNSPVSSGPQRTSQWATARLASTEWKVRLRTLDGVIRCLHASCSAHGCVTTTLSPPAADYTSTSTGSAFSLAGT